MSESIRTAVIGYGNIGRRAVEALMAAPDMEIAGVVEAPSFAAEVKLLDAMDIPLVTSIRELQGVQSALLCTPSRSVPDIAPEILALGINTVDCYDIHENIAGLRLKLAEIAQANNTVAVVSAGWDPGTDSIIRTMFHFMTPSGLSYTDFGPGMSMGHTVAVRALPGVENALSMTMPAGSGVHRRMVYVQLRDGASFAAIENAIKTDPYFAEDETHVFQVADVNQLIDVGHGVEIERRGVSGSTHNQTLRFSMRVNNPALTAQVMVAAARAGRKQAPGAYTLIQIPVIDFMYGDPDDVIRQLV